MDLLREQEGREGREGRDGGMEEEKLREGKLGWEVRHSRGEEAGKLGSDEGKKALSRLRNFSNR